MENGFDGNFIYEIRCSLGGPVGARKLVYNRRRKLLRPI